MGNSPSATRRRLALLLGVWIVLGAAVWNGFYDLYVSRGAREYLQLEAEAELGLTPRPSMAVVMARSKNAGLVAATAWSLVVVGAGWLSISWARKTVSDPPIEPVDDDSVPQSFLDALASRPGRPGGTEK